MAWLAAAIFGLAVLYFAIHHPGFWRVVLITLAVVVTLGVASGAWIYYEDQQSSAAYDAKRARAMTLIKQADIDLFEMTLTSNLTTHLVRGKVRNRSSYPLSSFKLIVTVQDCPEGKCETIGEDEMWKVGIDVPPGQVRAFDGSLGLYNMPVPKAQQWFYRVTELEAKLD